MKDNFSRQSDLYVRYRPRYPRELFEFIYSYVPSRQRVWDCATGNGQAAIVLSEHFSEVYATDISAKQIGNAAPAKNIHYSVQSAEHTVFPSSYFDLITVAQAMHWFDFDLFFGEVKRVARADAWIAAWTYSLPRFGPAIDKIIDHYQYETMNPYWDEARKYIDEDYKTIPFPFEEITTPLFSTSLQWTLADLDGYMNTWSALQKFLEVNHFNPVDQLISSIKPHWKGEQMTVTFRIHLRMGRIKK